MNPFVCKQDPLEAEIELEQITHPLHLYQPGSALLERLYERMEMGKRYQWPADMYSREV